MVTIGPNCAPVDEFRTELVESVQRLVHLVENLDRRWDRRDEHRQTIACMFELTPVNLDDLSPLSDPITVIGKDISPGGLHFYHQQTMPYQHVLVSPVAPTAIELADSPKILLKLRWCRFLRPGWYDSGGQFVRVVK